MGTNWAQKFGSTRRLKSGRFQARYTGPDGKRYKADSTFPDELAALGWLASVRKVIDLGTWEPPTAPEPKKVTPTVSEIVRHWLDVMKPQLRASTYKSYSDIVQARVIDHSKLSQLPVDKLTPVIVAEWWQDTARDFPGSPYRNSKAYHKLRSAIWLAVEYGYLASNPVHLRAARKRPKTRTKELPTTAELRAILGHVPHKYRFVTVLTLFHGLRVGEALAIKGKNISLSGGKASITVEGTLSRVPNGLGGVKMAYHPPKTVAGFRTVPILPEFVNVVRDHLTTYTPAPEEFATVTDRGSCVFDTSYRSIFNRAKSRAGIENTITPHYGRVYLITRLAEAGATPREIGKILGQEDVSTIVNVYMKAREQRSTELMLRINLDDD